ncbi:MAG: Ca-activated chloride channel family protein [Gammaproteobacteria bacterium]|jgi:Ca-activated chloride channel family protein
MFEGIIQNFHFLRPAWLYTVIPLIILLTYMVKHKLGSRSWDAICDQNLLPYILIGKPGGKQYGTVSLVALSGLLAILALAGPTWEQIPQPVYRDQSALLIALDLSRSMDVSDIKPSRLARARFKIADILEQRKTGQTALLVYANDAYVVTPLTNDTKTISSQITALTTDIMPVQGNNTVVALEKASELLKQAGLTSGDVLLITDEIDYERSQHAATKLVEQGYRLSVLGVGTAKGEPIPLPDGGFLKDKNGSIVIPAYDERGPRHLARQGQGIYQAMTLDDSDIQKIIEAMDRAPVADDSGESQFQSDTWQEQGPWLLLLLIPLVAVSFRRGTIAVIIVLLLPMPESAYAFDWQDLWLRSDQQAARDLEKGDFAGAAEKFSDTAWKAAAQYQASDFSAAIETLSTESLDSIEDADNLYNKGNALARAGKYEEAISAYNQSLELMPVNEDAEYNRDLIEKELEQQQKQEQQEQGKQDQKDKKDQDDSQSEQKQNKKDQQGEQQDQEQQDSDQNQDEQEQDQQSQEQQDQNTEKNEQENEQEQQKQQEQQTEESQEQSEQTAAESKLDEESQATEQWLRRIPDDPAGLLRRKFRYQYQQRDARQSQENQSW